METPILRRLFQTLTGTLLGLAVVILVWGRYGPGSNSPQVEPDYFLPAPLPAPVFTLTSHVGTEVSSAGFPGKVVVVFFGYTSCPDICPLTLSKLTRAMEILGETSERIQVLLVSVDPERDTPRRLANYLANFHPTFLGLTGTESEIRLVADEFGAFFARAGEGHGYTVDHTARTFVLDPAGTIPLTFPVTATANEMARHLSRLVGGVR